MSELTIEYRCPGDLKPKPGNSRVHSKKQIGQIAASIQLNGFVIPILIDENGEVIAGHGRLLASKQLGMTSVPTIRLEGLTDLQKTALRLADNRIAQNASWDPDLLRVEIETIRSIEPKFDFNIVGMPTAEVDKLAFSTRVSDPEDPLPLPPKHPVSRLGDVWRLSDHIIGCGDCRDEDFVQRLMGGRLADAAFLDPPYNVKINGHAVGRGRHREFAQASGEMSSAEFRRWLREGLSALVAASRDGAVHFICMDHRHIEDLSAACEGIYGERLNICVWVKSNPGMGSLYRSGHEFVFVLKVGKAPSLNTVELGRHGRNRTNVWEYPSVNTFQASRRQDLHLHPTVKPLGMVADAIRDVTRPGDLVMDGYLGSGTTLLACVRTGRRFVGVEIDPAYVDLALQRWADATGGRPELVATGETFDAVAAARRSEAL